MEEQKSIWLDGELVPWEEATLHVQSYGLLLGIGFFEALRCYETDEGPALFRLQDHLRRLGETMHTYLRPLPRPLDEIGAACKDVLRDNGLTQGYVRIVVFLGAGENPVAAPFRTAVVATASGAYVALPDEGGSHAMISSIQRPTVNSIPPAAKATGQYLNATLAQIEAMTSGYDAAILLNAAGNVVDGWVNNIFAVRDGRLRTPPISAGALAGITRATAMTLAGEQGIPVSEEELVRTDLYNADEVFLTGTQAGIVPVISVDRRQVGEGRPGPVTKALVDAYGDVVHGRTDAHAEWRELVGVAQPAGA